MIEDPDAYMALLGPEQLYLLLDGLAKTKPLSETEKPAEG